MFYFCITLSLLCAASVIIALSLYHSFFDLFFFFFHLSYLLISQFAFCLSDFFLIQPFRKDGKNTCEANFLSFAIIPVNLIA